MAGKKVAGDLATFRAELADVAQRRRQAFLARRGDGQAVDTRGWMQFTEARRTPPKPIEEWVDAREYNARTSAIHGPHTVDSACLESVDQVPDPQQGQVVMVKVAGGWFRCQQIGLHLHDHGERLFAHGVTDRRSCTVELAVATT